MDGEKKILIADDHSIVSRGLRYLITLNFQAYRVAEVSSLRELLPQLQTGNYTHLILDLNLDDGSSLDVLPEITKNFPDLYILIYSMMAEEVFAKKLMQYNISGFLSKKSSSDEIVKALQIFLQGGIYVSKNLRQSIDAGDNKHAGENIFQKLSINELKVLGLLFKGVKTKEIAIELGISQQTVATFKSRMFKKLGTDNLFEIQKLADTHNINLSGA